MKTIDKIGVGLAGVGNWAQYGHIPALRLLPEYRIVALSSRTKDRAAQLADQYSIPHHFTNVVGLASHEEVDLVVVLPPAPEHLFVVKAAFAAGKDVLCEWPLTTKTSDSLDLLAIARASGCRHITGLQRTVGAGARYLRDLIASGAVGQLRSVRMHVSVPSFGPVRPPGLSWTVDANNFSHVLSIYGGHFMHMLFAAVGQPQMLNAFVRTQFPELTLSGMSGPFPNTTPDGVVAQGVLVSGALFQIQIEAGKRNGAGLQIDITGFEGDLKVWNDKAFVTQRDNVMEGSTNQQPVWAELPVPSAYHQIPDSSLDFSVQDLAHLYAAFAHDRAHGTRTAPDFADAVALHRIIDAIVCSSATGQSIEVER